MKKFAIAFLAMFFMFMLMPLLAQQADEFFPIKLNEATIAAIQSILGIGLMAIVGFIKEGLKRIIKSWDVMNPTARHAIMYFVTLIVSIGAVYFTLSQMNIMTTFRLIIYTIYIWGFINKWWKMLKEIIQKTQAQA